MGFRGIHGLSKLSGIMAHGVVLAAPCNLDFDIAGSLGIRLYDAPIPNYTLLHRSVNEMNMVGWRVGYPASLRGSQSLFGIATQLGEMSVLVKLHASDTHD